MSQKIDIFKEGIFSLNTRRFGTLAEIMIKKLYDLQWSGNKSFDLYDPLNDKKIEVKFSRVMQKHSDTIREENVIDQCMSDAYLENRSLNANDIFIPFDSNIQQIKCHNFDYLFYGLFFMDCVEIYGVCSQHIHSIPGYSDHQHAGNIGEGQFHLNNSSINYHRNNFFKKALTYSELFRLLQN